MQCFGNRSTLFRQLCIGYILVFTCDIAYIISAITAQLSMAKTAVFQLNFTWNLISTLISALLLYMLGQTWRIERKHYLALFTTAIFDYVNSTCYFLAAVFIPVGNSEGVFVCMLIICTTAVDLIRKLITRQSIISALMASTGVILLVQPWHLVKPQTEIITTFRAPCQIISSMMNETIDNSSCYHVYHNQGFLSDNDTDMNNNSNVTANNHLSATSTSGNHGNLSILSNCWNSNSSTSNTSIVHIDETMSVHEISGLYASIGNSRHSQLYGYILVTVSALAETVNSNLAQNLMDDYPVASLIFWASAIQTGLSLVLTFCLQPFPGFGGWSFPTSKYCFIFTFMYTVFVSIMDVTDYYAYNFLPVSQVAIMQAWITIVLYICQRTILFNEGNANILEIIGASMAFCGSALCPILQLKKKHAQKKNVEYTEIESDD